jgi:hypothetical protein
MLVSCGGVVVVDEAAEPVAAFYCDGSLGLSANAFAFGARTGVLMISIPSLAKTRSKSRVNLLSRSRIR